MKAERIISELTETNIKYFESVNRGWTVEKDFQIAISWEDGTSYAYVVFKGPFTSSNMCRDCGTYYELDTGGRLYRIEKETLEIISVKQRKKKTKKQKRKGEKNYEKL